MRWDGSGEIRGGGESYQSRSSKGKVELDGLGGIETNYSSGGKGEMIGPRGRFWD